MKKKTQKQIIEAMLSGEQYKVNQFDDRFIKTDFTPKKKPSFKARVITSVKAFFKKIKNNKLLLSIKNWFYNTVKKPYIDKKEKKEKERYIKELKYNFSKKFNVDVEKTIRIMNSPGYSPTQYDNEALLVENRMNINKRKSLYTFAPFMYNPEVVDIHNENLNESNPNINQIIANDTNDSVEKLDKQLEFFRKRPHLTVKGRKS
ncbi:MAG: hypothetical protein ABFD07_19175 [Methanobacterium sp.]